MWKTIKVDRALLEFAIKGCVNVRYEIGTPRSKPALHSRPGDFSYADCSGLFRWLIYYITHGLVKPPDGSWYQRKWCKEQGFKSTSYDMLALHDHRLRVGFIPPSPGQVGHVFLCINGRTIESYGGHGFGRREWDTPVLKRKTKEVFVLTDPLV